MYRHSSSKRALNIAVDYALETDGYSATFIAQTPFIPRVVGGEGL